MSIAPALCHLTGKVSLTFEGWAQGWQLFYRVLHAQEYVLRKQRVLTLIGVAGPRLVVS